MKTMTKLTGFSTYVVYAISILSVFLFTSALADYSSSPPTLSLAVGDKIVSAGTNAELPSNLDIVVKADMPTPSDGRSITYKYVWYKNNIVQNDLTDFTVPKDLIKKGDTWRCEVTPLDGKLGGPTSQVQMTIVNSAPTFVNPISRVNVIANHPVQFSMAADDVDKDTLKYSDPLMPVGVSINPGTRVVSVNPTLNIEKTYTLNFGVSDGDTTTKQTVEVSIIPAMGKLDLSSYLPPVGDQGQQYSCASWATGYYYKTFHEAKERNWSLTDTKHIFSPAFIYNQLAQGNLTRGSTFEENFYILTTQGCAPLDSMSYNSSTCAVFPNRTQYEAAMPYRADYFTYLGKKPNITSMRQILNLGNIIVMGVPVYYDGKLGSLGATGGNDVCDGARKGSSNVGGHAITIVGFDDNRQYTNSNGQTCYGAFKFVNSWGSAWSSDGYEWLSYNFVSNEDTWAYTMTDRVGYVVKGIADFHITHPNRSDLEVGLGVGSTAHPNWYSIYLNNAPANMKDIDAAMDITDAITYMPPSQTNDWCLEVRDVQNRNIGTPDEFIIKCRNLGTAEFEEYIPEESPLIVSDGKQKFASSHITGWEKHLLAPTLLTAAAVSESQINLTWQDNATGETGFKIEMSTDGVNFTQIDTVKNNVTTYSAQGLTAGTLYYFRVCAYKHDWKDSGYSNIAQAKTLGGITVKAPSTLAAQAVSASQINLTWTDNSNNETGFIIESKVGAAGTWAQIAAVGANVTAYSHTGLTADTTYYYRVKAYLDQNNASQSQNQNAGAAGTVGCTNNKGNKDTTSQVRLESDYSNIAQVTTLKLLTAPTTLTATAVSTSQINLAWKDNSNNEKGFKIEMRLGSTGTWNQIAVVGANVTTYNNTGLTPATTYDYRVRAYMTQGVGAVGAVGQNADGTLGCHDTEVNSDYSNIAEATTFQLGVTAPTTLTATAVSTSQINLAWKDNSNNETGFKIEMRLGSTGTWSQIAVVGANVTTYNNTGLTPDTTYDYRVRAYMTQGVGAVGVVGQNADGTLGCHDTTEVNSDYSNIAEATTFKLPIGAPTTLTAQAVSMSQINLAWKDNANNETGFKIERKTGSGGTWAEIATVGANVTTYNNTGLAAGTTYIYRVRAYNSTGYSDYSNEASATTLNVPTVPSLLTAQAVSGTEIDLAWQDSSSDETGFKIERKTGAGGTWAQIATVGPNVTTYNNTGLSIATTYVYRVRATNATGDSAYSNEATATTFDVPKGPSNLTAQAVSGTQINLAWKDNSSDETGFKIERKTGAGGTWAQIATVGPNVTTYNNTGLSMATTYVYRVRATNATGDSAYSNEATATTFDVPKVPSNLTAQAVSGTEIDLSWQDNSTDETGFKIERKTGAGGTWAEIAIVGPNVATYKNTGLTMATTYVYRVRATNATGDSAYSNEATATTFDVPKVPSNLTAQAVSGTEIDLAWQDNSTDETGFKIERKTGAGGTWAEIATVGPNVATFKNTGLTMATTFVYRVRATNATGDSAYSNEATATTFDVPKAPGDLTAQAISGTQINLAWKDNSSDETGFKIERKTGSTGTWAQIATVGPNVTTYNNTGLSMATTYVYRVRATNATGDSAYSNEATATTFDVPKVPSNLTAQAVSGTEIDLAWQDNSSDELGFKIERKTGSTGTWAEIATVGPNVATYKNTGLTMATTYVYRVRATNATGDSAYSNEATATTFDVPKVPSNLTAQAVSGTEIDLAWQDNSSDELGFKIERKTGSTGTWAEIATVGPNVATFKNTGLAMATTYVYRVRATNATGDSAYSNEATATTFDVPTVPGNLTAQAVSGTEIDLSWQDNSSDETGFKIERYELGSTQTFAQIAVVGPNVAKYNDTGLKLATTYVYRVRAANATGDSGYSNEARATTFGVPKAPSNLTAQAVSSSQINLSWEDNASDELGFKIERKDITHGSGQSFSEIATVGANVITYQDKGLTPGTTYVYRVRATNATGDSTYSNEASATTFGPPMAPDSLTAQAVSDSQINLTWTDNSSDETGFRIESYKVGSTATWSEIATVGPNVKSFSNSGLDRGTTYKYRVCAYNEAGNSTYTNEASATTFDVPIIPTVLKAQAISGTEIDLVWQDNSSDETGFKIERKTGAGGTWAEIATVGANVTTYNNTGLTAGTTYVYRVRATNASGDSAYSNEASATTFDVPIVPNLLTARAISQTEIDLAWQDNSSDETGFKIERKTGAGGTWAEIATVGAGVATYNNTGLTAGTTYVYRVRATNATGDSAYSNEASATTLDVPIVPNLLTAQAISGTEIDLAWQDNSSDETGFKIERKTGAGGTWAEIATVGPNVATFKNTGLTMATTYVYRVRATNASGDSAYSNEASATTFDIPTVPTILTAQAISGTEIDLAWQDNSSDETGFKVERKTGAGGTWAEIATVGANVTTYNNTGLAIGTTYVYRVRAANVTGDSTYSNEASATTFDVPKAPRDLTAQAMSGTEIDLIWQDMSSDETGFKIERKTGANGTWAEIATVAADVTTYKNTGLSLATTYVYRVRATNAIGNSAYSNESSATTFDLPVAPSNLTAQAISGTEIDLAWQDNSSDESGFKIERKTGAGGTWAQIATVGPNVKAYGNIGLTANTTYVYRVRSTNATGDSAYSNEASATTLNQSAAPTNLTAQAASSSQIDLAWTDNSSNETGFVIEVSQLGTPWSDVATVAADTATYSAQGLQPSTTYYFQVRSLLGSIRSAPSNVAQATTMGPAAANAPSNLTATTVSSSQIDLAWHDNSSDETGFVIEMSQLGTPWSDFATVTANSISYSAQGLQPSTTYYFQVRSLKDGVRSNPSNVAHATTAAGGVPVAPTNLVATAVSTSQIDLTWTDNSTNETGFVIEMSLLGTPWSDFATVTSNTTTYSAHGLQANTTYYFEVRALNGAVRSNPTNYAGATTTIVVTPNAPSNLVATAVSTSQINLTWADNSSNETGFVIEMSTLGTPWSDFATLAADTTSYSAQGLQSNTTYYFQVRSFNDAVRSNPSNLAQATTTALVVPNAPSNLVATAVSASQINLTWTDNATNETGFVIQMSQLGTQWSDLATVAANATSYSAQGLQVGTTYYFQVRALNGAVRSDPSNLAQATTTVVAVPNAPSNLVATAISGEQIDLTWTDNSTNETGFVIQVSQLGTPWSDLANVTANTASYSAQGLLPNTTYYFQVRAVNGAVSSGPSNLAQATTTNPSTPLPGAPTNLTGTAVSSSRINLTWADNSTNETGFVIQMSLLGTPWSDFATVGPNTTSYSAQGLTSKTTYYFQVRSYNATGRSAPTNYVGATTF